MSSVFQMNSSAYRKEKRSGKYNKSQEDQRNDFIWFVGLKIEVPE